MSSLDEEFDRLPSAAAKSGGSNLDADFDRLPDHPGTATTRMSMGQAAVKGLQNVPTLGLGDHLGAAMQAGLLKLSGDPSTFGENYSQALRENQGEDTKARQDQPLAYYGAGGAASLPLASAMAPIRGAGVVGRIGAAVGNGALQGGIGAAASSQATGADYAKDIARGVGLGGLTAGVLGGAGEALAAGASKLGQVAQGRVDDALQRARTVAQGKVDATVASARGELGAASQGANRTMENVLRLEQAGLLTPEQVSKLQALKASGAWDDLGQNLAGSSLEALPSQAGTIAAKRAALQELQQGAGAAVDKEAARLASAGEAAAQVGERAKRYLPRAAGSIAGKVLGSAEGPGLVQGQVLGPMVHSLKRMVNAPSVQAPLFGSLGKVARTVASNPERLGVYGGILSRALDPKQGGGNDRFAAVNFVLSKNDARFQALKKQLDEEPDKEGEK